MKRNFFNKRMAASVRMTACAIAASFSCSVAAQDVLTPPANLSATADFNKVVLTWERGEALDTLLNEGFEGTEFPSAGWQVKTTNTYDSYFSWFHYPTDEFKENVEDWADWINSGDKSAAIMFDDAAPHDDGTSAVQNEWLVMPATKGAKYVNFYTYIDPQIVEWGADEEFPDHYYVKVSHDGGTTWTELWDARYDRNGASGWQFVTLYLGDCSEGDPIVAFQAVSDTTNEESGLYFAWIIDDVQLLSAQGATKADAAHSPAVSPLLGSRSHRAFTPSGVKVKRPARAQQNNVPAECYNVYLDDEPIAENIKTNTYTDTSDKTPGLHTYAVQAVSVSQDMTSELVQIPVEIAAPTVNAPTNVQLSYEYDESTGKYNVDMHWDAPEGERTPSYYNTYCNGALFGGYLEDTSVGQSGVAKGVYTYTVTAVYENPDGESEPVGDIIALGTRNTVRNLADNREAGILSLSWTAPKPSDYTVTDYSVYRGNTLLGITAQTEFTDTESPEGLYDYSVKVNYADGVQSLPVTVSVKYGTVPSYKLPFSEDFTGGLKPSNWTVEKVDGKMKDNYMWRFDNWYDLPVSGGNFAGEFASVSSSVAGYTNVYTTLDTPPLLRNSMGLGESTFVEFDMDYMAGGKTSSAGLYYSYDGENWAAVGDDFTGYEESELTDGQTCQPVHMTCDVTDCFPNNSTPVYFAWKYNGKLAHHLAIDNINIYNGSSSSSIAKQRIGSFLDWHLDGNKIVLSGKSMQRIQLFTTDGACSVDVDAHGADNFSLPLNNSGIYMLKVSTADGTKIVKLGNMNK